jgi:hypothetical protein
LAVLKFPFTTATSGTSTSGEVSVCMRLNRN